VREENKPDSLSCRQLALEGKRRTRNPGGARCTTSFVPSNPDRLRLDVADAPLKRSFQIVHKNFDKIYFGPSVTT